MELSGTILAGEDYEPLEGRVVVEDGEIAAVERTATDSNDIVCPAFVNAHTHVGCRLGQRLDARPAALPELQERPGATGLHERQRAGHRLDLLVAGRLP